MFIKKRSIWFGTFGALLLAFPLLTIQPARAQLGFDIGVLIAYLKQILSTVGQQTAFIVDTQKATNSQLNFLQQTMYPINQIDQIRRQSQQYGQTMVNLQYTFNSPVNSAVLPQTSTFEKMILGGDANNIGSIAGNYQKVYGALPEQKTVSADVYSTLDATDAQAQAALKKSVQLDAIAQQEEKLSLQYMQQLTSAAPGTAELITAQVAAWNLQASAYTQQGLAQLLRAQSANTSLKAYETKSAASANQKAAQYLRLQ